MTLNASSDFASLSISWPEPGGALHVPKQYAVDREKSAPILYSERLFVTSRDSTNWNPIASIVRQVRYEKHHVGNPGGGPLFRASYGAI